MDSAGKALGMCRKDRVPADDLVELDFSPTGSGQNVSVYGTVSSVASIERPMRYTINHKTGLMVLFRSRTSSFGGVASSAGTARGSICDTISTLTGPPLLSKKYAGASYVDESEFRVDTMPHTDVIHAELEEQPEDYHLEEVRCFIAPADQEKIAALTAKDTTSLRSHRTDPGAVFETIEEDSIKSSGSMGQKSLDEARAHARTKRSGRREHPRRKSTISQNQELPDQTEDYVLLGNVGAPPPPVVSPPLAMKPMSAKRNLVVNRKLIPDEYALIEVSWKRIEYFIALLASNRLLQK